MARFGPVVGRQAEIDAVWSLLCASPRRAVVLGGEPGVGKTRVAREVADRWVADGGQVEWFAGTPGTRSIPFASVARLLPEMSQAHPEPSTGRDAELIRRAVTDARGQPTRLIVVDDGHQLDDFSAALVHHLVLDGWAPVLLSVRSGEPTPGGLSTLWRDRHAERIDLLPLSSAESRELVVGLLGGAVSDPTADELFRVSEGNPLLLGELVRDATDSGSLRAGGTQWEWDGTIGGGRRLREAVSARLGSAGEGARRLVALVALGEPLGLSILRRLLPDVDLEAAERRFLIAITRDGGRVEARLAHPLLGEVLALEAGGPSMAELRLSLADAIAATGARRRGDALLEATLRLDAGSRSHSALLHEAANRALVLGDAVLAQRMAQAAAVSGEDPVSGLFHGEALIIQERYEEAIVMLETALATVPSDALRARAAFDLQKAYECVGDMDRSGEVLERTLLAVEEPVWQGVLGGHLAQYLFAVGSTAAGTAMAEELLVVHDDPRVRLRLTSTAGVGRALAGRTAEALAFVSAMLPDALRLQDELPVAPAWVVNAQAIGLLLSGQIDAAVTFLTNIGEMIEIGGSGSEEGSAMLAAFRGRVHLAGGQIAQALRYLGKATAPGFVSLGGPLPWVRSLEAEALALVGEHERARAIADEVAGQRMVPPTFDNDAVRARAWVRALRGELSGAVDDLLRAASEHRSEGQYALEIQALHDAVRLGALQAAGPLLIDAAHRTDGLWCPAMRAHVEGLQSGRGEDLEAAGVLFAQMGAALHAAEAMAEASRAYDKAGLRARAAATARRRDELLDLCGAVRTPALHDLTARVHLTRREREVVELAAQGLTNREVADRLFVSLRTAEGHLYRAFAKLGVEDRSELASVVGSDRDRSA